MPQKPVLRGSIEACEAAEAGFDVPGLVEKACAGIERIEIEPET